MNFQCILAAIIVVALKGMFKQFAELKRLWNISIIDFVSTHSFLFISIQDSADLYLSNHFPVNMLGLIQMRFGCDQLRPVEASWCARIIGPQFWQNATGLLLVSHFQTRLQFSKDSLGHNVQNQPVSDSVLVTVSGLG